MNYTKITVTTALFTALTALFTIFPQIRITVGGYVGGYIHLGDAVIIAAAFLIGKYGIPAAAIGSAIADTVSGYFLPYAPVTFVLKGLMAFAVYIIIGKKPTLPRIIAAALASEAIMIAGYFFFDVALYGFYLAAGTLVFSLVQAACGIVIGSLLCYILKKMRFKEKYNIM